MSSFWLSRFSSSIIAWRSAPTLASCASAVGSILGPSSHCPARVTSCSAITARRSFESLVLELPFMSHIPFNVEHCFALLLFAPRHDLHARGHLVLVRKIRQIDVR